MDKGVKATRIESNIINYLATQINCPVCGELDTLALNMLYNQDWGKCPKCSARMVFGLSGKQVENLALAFENLHEELRKLGLPLYFPHSQMTTIWEKDDNT